MLHVHFKAIPQIIKKKEKVKVIFQTLKTKSENLKLKSKKLFLIICTSEFVKHLSNFLEKKTFKSH